MPNSNQFKKFKYKRVVIKIGSSLLVEKKENSASNTSFEPLFCVRYEWLKSLISECSNLVKNGIDVVITTSGAVALGRNILKFDQKKLSLTEKQAAAAVGQIELISHYQKLFREHNIQVAQILLTADDCNSRQRFLNCKNTALKILNKKAIPIFNENDSVAVDEIKIGDNDRLAGRVAQMIEADLLILLSDIDGLYDKNPRNHADANFISEVIDIDARIEKMAGKAGSEMGTGGMITKISAAKMATNAGCDTIITSGTQNNALEALFNQLCKEGEAAPIIQKKFTIFRSKPTNHLKSKNISKGRNSWLIGLIDVKGEIIINKKAGEILKQKKVSILPIGAIAVKGKFEVGDAVMITDEEGNKIASGISNYHYKDAEKVLQKNSEEIKKIFGKNIKTELVHINNLVMIS